MDSRLKALSVKRVRVMGDDDLKTDVQDALSAGEREVGDAVRDVRAAMYFIVGAGAVALLGVLGLAVLQ